MALEMDKTTEARRKALRNGEEDPVVVAQRFLNIYRQMHILSPERKEAFNKMLLELSPEIRGIFSSLPGGAMLQDYADELAEKSGVQKSVHSAAAVNLNEDAHQQAKILATALAQAQSQAAPAAAPAGTAKISFDKDFAGEFAKIMSGLIQQQTVMQKESLEKLALDLSKTQLFIAKNMKENKDEQRQDFKELCQTIAAGSQAARKEQQQEFGELCKVVAESFVSGKEEQRRELGALCQTIAETFRSGREAQSREIGELCKAIMQSQTALSASLSNLNRETPAVSVAAAAPTEDMAAAKQLIEVVLEGQKQLNRRLDKVEELSAGKANDNKELIAAFEKSQSEIIKSLGKMQTGTTVVKTEDNSEKLFKLLDASQEKLIKSLVSANIWQNNSAQANNNTNANNIHINAADNSAQIMLLADKIASLQASNEKNLEKAIAKTIEEQGKLYDKISRRQTKELADALSEALQNVPPPVYAAPVMPSSDNMRWPAGSFATTQLPPEPVEDTIPADTYTEPPVFTDNGGNIPAEDNLYPSAGEESVAEMLPEQPDKKKKKNNPADILPPVTAEPEDISLLPADIPVFADVAENESDSYAAPELTVEDIPVEQSSVPGEFDAVLPDEPKSEELPALELPVEPEPAVAVDNTEGFENTVADSVEIEPVEQPEETPAAAPVLSGDDWGFTSSPQEKAEEPAVEINESDSDDWGFGTADVSSGSNDNEEGQDWEWVYVEDNDDAGYPVMEAIGDNSYICSGDLYEQPKISEDGPVVYSSAPLEISTAPGIIDDSDETEAVDPYQNSILKD